MTKEISRLTYRLSNEMLKKIKEEASKRNITVNAEINRILWWYYFERNTNNYM